MTEKEKEKEKLNDIIFKLALDSYYYYCNKGASKNMILDYLFNIGVEKPTLNKLMELELE